MSKPMPAWARIRLTAVEREALAHCVWSDGQPPSKCNVFVAAVGRLRKKGVIDWNTDGIYLTELGRYIAMRNPATEPTT